MRHVFPFTRPPRMTGAAAMLALITAGVPCTPGMAQEVAQADGGAITALAQAAGPWACETPPSTPSTPELGAALDPAALRLMASLLLSAQETALGIRSDQMDAWRAYSAALIAFLPSGDQFRHWLEDTKRADADAFGLAQDMARAAIARAEKARALQEAVARLKAVMTPAQMDMARQIQGKLMERIAHFIAWRQREWPGVPL